MNREPTILIVDDGPSRSDGPTVRLDDYDVHRAAEGETAPGLSPTEVDVVVLDRRFSGGFDGIPEWIRAPESPLPVVLLTDGDPPGGAEAAVDECLRCPVPATELEATVDRLHRRATYDAKLQEYFSLATERAALETGRSRNALTGDPEYERLRRRLRAVREELDEILARLPEEDAYLVATDGAAGVRVDG